MNVPDDYIIPGVFGTEPFLVVDEKGIVKFCNEAALSIDETNGFTTQENFCDFFNLPEQASQMLVEVFAKGAIAEYGLIFKKNGGPGVQIFFEGFTVSENEEKKAFLVGKKNSSYNLHLKLMAREIADYKYALDEAAIVAITDQKGIIKYVNENFCTISKYSREELIGNDHRLVNSGFHPKSFIKNLWTTIANGNIWRGEIKNRAKDGTYYWVKTTIVPFLDEKGKPYQYLAIREDITNNKKNEEHRELYELIIRSSDDAIISKDLKGIITSWNVAAENIFGYTAEEAIGKNILILMPGDRQDEEAFIMTKINKGKVVKHYETERLAKGGAKVPISLTVSPIISSTGEIIGASKIARDISERIRIQAELKRLNDELEIRVKERTEEIESFSYSVSHDLRAPLRAVNGYARILEEDYQDTFDEEGKRLLGEVQLNAKKMGALIDDLLSFSRLGRKGVEKVLIDMNKLTEYVIRELKQSMPHHAEINVGSLCPVMADPSLMHHVMTNLISNAVKYSSKRENPIVEISSVSSDKECIFSIQDNGVGFDMEYVKKLFGVFQRLHSIEEFPGTGVGLAIVQRIIQKHNGRVWAEGKIDEGAAFHFALPSLNQ